jgi:hypothetical protein
MLWCIYLYKERKFNHSWLLPFFLVYFVSDTTMLFVSPARVGGFGFFNIQSFGWEVWVFIACLFWLSWFVIPIWCACKLLYGKIHWLYLWPLLILCIVLSGSETLGLSTVKRRFIMHVLVEPTMLILSMVLIVKYVARQIHYGERIDFLSYSVAITSMMLLLKLGLLFNGSGLLKRWQSHTFYFLFMATVVLAYFGHKRLLRWLTYH